MTYDSQVDREKIQANIDSLVNGGFYRRDGMYIFYNAERVNFSGEDIRELGIQAKAHSRFGGMPVAAVDRKGDIHYGTLQELLGYDAQNVQGNQSSDGLRIRVDGPDGSQLVGHVLTGANIVALFRIMFKQQSIPAKWIEDK